MVNIITWNNVLTLECVETLIIIVITSNYDDVVINYKHYINIIKL